MYTYQLPHLKYKSTYTVDSPLSICLYYASTYSTYVCLHYVFCTMWKAITAAISPLPVVKAVSDINKTVVEGTPEELLVALKSPVASIRSITDECAVTYQEKLREARDNKAEKCEYSPTSSQQYLCTNSVFEAT